MYVPRYIHIYAVVKLVLVYFFKSFLSRSVSKYTLDEYYLGVIKLMPGMTSVELVEQESDSVIIRTNEGLMKRTNISKDIEAENIVVECDEEYQAGSKNNILCFYFLFCITLS